MTTVVAKPYYIGVMSGTSLDGIDVVLCKVESHGCELIASESFSFPKTLKQELLETIEGETTLSQVGQLECRVSELFSQTIQTFLGSMTLPKTSIEAVGLHGQTVWHEPKGRCATTMQLVDPSYVAAKTGLKVVVDFRRKDVALGGQGAPLAPAFHAFLFQESIAKGSVGHISVVNIGGMANITVLGRERLIGYDIGPGNVLLDAWVSKHQQRPYDKEGSWAKEGSVNYTLLEALLADEYFAKPYPKSTGREKFHLKWLEKHLAGSRVSSVDVQATLLELTAQTVAHAVLEFQSDVMVLCGGGAQNSYLVERIKAMMPNVEVVIAQHSDMLEAMMMAWLAYMRVHHQKVNIKEVTGASANTVLGGVYV
jgi:anhydro-N-acetylmuramic acid kinase